MSKKTSDREKPSLQSLNEGNDQSSKVKKTKGGFVDNSERGQKLAQLQAIANNSPQVKQAVQLQAIATSEAPTTQLQEEKQPPNKTGLPDNIKSGVEKLSGISMDDVQVHRNSDKPAQMQAEAYAQGTDIHLAPGKETHLAHETWHVAQQKQGRVKPTTSSKGTPVNDSPKLEKEADSMGAKAKRVGGKDTPHSKAYTFCNDESTLFNKQPLVNDMELAQLKPLKSGKLNVAGEDHNESEDRRDDEALYAADVLGKSVDYKLEGSFTGATGAVADPVYLRLQHSLANMNDLHKKFKADTDVYYVEDYRADILAFAKQAQTEAKFLIMFGADPGGLYATLLSYIDEVILVIEGLDHVGDSDDASDTSSAVTDDEDSRDDSSVQASIGKSIDLVVFAYETLMKSGHMEKEEDVSMKRATSMHQAANSRANDNVLWKIGDLHIDEIKSIKEAKNYHLLTRSEFNTDYDKWKRSRLSKKHF